MSDIVHVNLGARAYDVQVGAGLLARAGALIAPYAPTGRVFVVTDRNVARLHRPALVASLESEGLQNWTVTLPAGEAIKSFRGLERVCRHLLQAGIGRRDLVVALGGGVIGDLAGLAAGLVKRGVDFVQIPTTLLAQVDSSVGGKTAINSAAGKNLVGAFHQPALVLADLATLETLPERELRAGYAEVVKYGLLGDADFFAWCDSRGAAMLAGDAALREYAVAYSVTAKARIVAADERETSGTRALLNLGHTFGHALEAETGYSGRLLHGEAVALGMVLAARYSARRALLPKASAEHVAGHMAGIGLPSELAALGLDCDGAALTAHMLHDKKMDAGTLPFVLMKGIGAAFLAKDVDLADVAAFLEGELKGKARG